MAARLECLDIEWEGDLGVQSSHMYKGILFLFTAPDLFGGVPGDDEFAPYIRDTLAASDAVWRISSWHVLMREMQIGGKSDQSGWGVYEESRRGGAIVATGHEHSYGRTHPLSHCATQTVASFDNEFTIARDDPETPQDEGVTFVHYNGLGGQSVREQERCFPTAAPYGCSGEWAAIYAEQQGANYGALFGTFNYGGYPRRAHFYFKDIDNYVADEFTVETTWGPCCEADLDGSCRVDAGDFLVMLGAWGTDPDGPPDLDGNGVVAVPDLLDLLFAWGPCAIFDLLGDLDGDGDVDAVDFLYLMVQWGPCPPPPSACTADLDGDGAVAVPDLLILLSNWS